MWRSQIDHVTPTASAPLVAVKLGNCIIVEGRVVPERGVAFSFQSGSNIAEMPAVVGDWVDSGKLLARLDTRQLVPRLDKPRQA